jgi:hypothetical protein
MYNNRLQVLVRGFLVYYFACQDLLISPAVPFFYLFFRVVIRIQAIALAT